MRAGTSPEPAVLRRVVVAHSSSELYGSDRALLESVRALTGRGCDVTVLLPEPGPLELPLVLAGATVQVVPTVVLKKSDVCVTGLVRLLASALRVLPAGLRALRESRPQLVYVNTINVPLWIPLAAVLRIPVVCHVHEAEDSVPRPVALALALPLLLTRHVVCNSEAARQVLLHTLPALTRRTSTLYNGVPGPGAAATDARARIEGPVRLVLVGRLSHRKGTDVAVAALAELRRRGVQARLQLVGSAAPGQEWFEQRLRDQIRDAGLADAVELTGFETDVWPRLDAADIVLVTSRVEPFGNVAVEGALARRPAVVSSVQGLREIVRNGQTGLLVPPDDPVALADAVLELCADWPRALAMAAVAERDAHVRFGVARYATQVHALLSRCLRGRPQAAAPAH